MMTRQFWGWDKSAIQRAVEHLTRGWSGGELDLSTTLLILPTTEAGRRLREALARATAEKEGAVTAPHVWSPEMALFPASDRASAASSLQARLAWVKVLLGVRLTEFSHLFPLPPEEQSWGWALSAADMLVDLQQTLGAGGVTFTSAASSSHVQQDAERWQELARLEQLYLQAISASGKTDLQQCKARRAAAPWWPESVEQILVLAVLDAPPLFSHWLQQASQRVPVDLWVHAPAELAYAFDSAGRPTPTAWAAAGMLPAPVPIPSMTVAQNATQQADALVDLLRELVPTGHTALGVCDPAAISCVKERLALEGVRVFEPGGVAAQSLGLWHILENVHALCATGAWAPFATLLRVPELRRAWLGESGSKVCEQADSCLEQHLPMTLEHALEVLPAEKNELLTKALHAAQQLCRQFSDLPLSTALRSFFTTLYGAREFKPQSPQDRSLLELIEAALELAQELLTETQAFGLTAQPSQLFALLMQQLGQQQVTEPRGEVDLVLQGWLELLWEAAPQLIVAGLNEEHVPGILLSHPFLPDSLRDKLGLASQASRYARDACLLHALAAQRQPGALRILCGQWGERGESLKPSRLLMRGPVEDLPAQVRKLFPSDESLPPPPQPLRTQAWKLRPRKVDTSALEKISVSALNSYLACPFRYYLSDRLKMSAVSAQKQEMHAGDFGTLIHVAFEKLANDPAMQHCTEEALLRGYLCTAARAEAERLYGKRLPVMVRLQVESAVQRLTAAAEVEAQQRAAGWTTLESELNFSKLAPEKALHLAGVRLTGKVDRIESRAGVDLRLLDFKTSDSALKPKEAHCKAISGRTHLSENDMWKVFSAPDGKEYVWINLQLPLYAAALEKLNYKGLSAAYLNLPKGVQDTVIYAWEDFGPDYITAAVQCAEEAVRRIQSGLFWPPAPATQYDPYAELFLGDAEASVEWV